ncbi:aryl-alcohol dehydrogenase-like predicted oxidoreductase [Rhodoligotrophos appendicifer]|uniref:aldo/keto reductase n=1 Tax=Rhodoligotrophos appendicifer TaxID=987056 RepID=UPI001185B3C4|nr:aldo/keto reductase [Rhodoligotrophos appendicifer]
MRQVRLGKSGLLSSALGLGCMGMSEFYGPQDDAQSLKTLDRTIELGITMLDTSDIYGRGHNEELVGKAIAGRRERVLVASKFGIVRDPTGPSGSLYDRDLNNRPDYMRACCEASLKRLGTDYIDLYYVHRMDPNIPIEDTVGALGQLMNEGKIRGIGLSEVGADILKRASAVHPIAALQSEYSLWERAVEAETLPACRALDIAFVPYSPLGRGFLTGAITSTSVLNDNDIRQNSPRFQEGNIDRNLELLQNVKALAAKRGCTLGQIALAWLFGQGNDIVPIPGTKRIKYLEENAGAVDILLTKEELASIDLSSTEFAGSRHWVPTPAVS